MAVYFDCTVVGTYADSRTETLGNFRVDPSDNDVGSRAKWAQDMRQRWEPIYHADPDSGDAAGLVSLSVNVRQVTV